MNATAAERALGALGIKPGETLVLCMRDESGAPPPFEAAGIGTIAVDIGHALRNGTAPRSLQRTATWGYCVDVLEHLPPARVHQAISQLAAGVSRGAFFSIRTRPAKTSGWPCLIAKPARWWFAALRHDFASVVMDEEAGTASFACAHSDSTTAAEQRLRHMRVNAARTLPWIAPRMPRKAALRFHSDEGGTTMTTRGNDEQSGTEYQR